MTCWTVTAWDEFDRLFHYTQVETPNMIEYMVYPNHFWSYLFQQAARSILREMGEATSAEWHCEEFELEV